MRIAFDATTLQGQKTGIGYYTEHLLHSLLEVAPHHDFMLLANGAPKTSRPVVRELEIRGCRFPLRTLWMQGCAPLALWRSRPAVAHFTNSIMPMACPTPAVLTVHDMSLYRYPGLHPYRRRLTRPLVSASLKRAQAVITVSQTARRDILATRNVAASRVHVVHEAAAPQFRPIKEGDSLKQVRLKYGLPERFLLFVGAIEPRKNLIRLIDAFATLEGNGIPQRLVLAGPHLWGYREVARHIRKRALMRTVLTPGYIAFEDLPALYNLADAFVFPSLYEGFGLPVVEAMACGLPVLTSQDSAMAEIAGDAAVLVDPMEIASIEEGLRRLLGQEGLDQRCRASLHRAAEFSWRRAAEETLRVYESVAG